MSRIILSMALFAPLLHAGIHIGREAQNPLPVSWKGYLLDLRAVRLAAAAPAKLAAGGSPLREFYRDAALELEAKAKKNALSADDLAELGGLYLRLGQTEQALTLLKPAAGKHPEHFALAANLGAAWQVAGDLQAAANQLEEAVRLAPEKLRSGEDLHLKLVRHRLKAKKGDDALDPLFEFDKLPKDALAQAQQLALWLPNDPRVLWQLAEVAHSLGDARTAANLMDGAVGEFGLGNAAARERRKAFRQAADELDTKDDHKKPFGGIKFASSRVFPRRFDAAKLPKIDPNGTNPMPWAALDETEVAKPFEPKYLPYVGDLDGKTVSITGFLQPTRRDAANEFLLGEFAVGCWFCDAPGPLQIVQVTLAKGKTIDPIRGPITVTGTWRLNRSEPERLLFTIDEAAVKLAE